MNQIESTSYEMIIKTVAIRLRNDSDRNSRLVYPLLTIGEKQNETAGAELHKK